VELERRSMRSANSMAGLPYQFRYVVMQNSIPEYDRIAYACQAGRRETIAERADIELRIPCRLGQSQRCPERWSMVDASRNWLMMAALSALATGQILRCLRRPGQIGL